MNNWIWSVTQGNWSVVKNEKVWAVGTIKKTQTMTKGDRIIFYVKGTMHFCGIYGIVSEWHESKTKWKEDIFPDAEQIREIDLEEIQLGYADIDKIASKLKFIEKKYDKSIGIYLRGSPAGPANFGKRIDDSDYNVMLEELEIKRQEPNFKKIKKNKNEYEELVEISEKPSETIKMLTPEKRTIEDIFKDVDKGKYAIPNFQRYWKWKKNQIEELWESIFQSYYVGSLLHWETKEQKLGTTSVIGAPEHGNSPELILDGQQRVTSIYYAIKAPDEKLPNNRPHVFFLNINALLGGKESSEIIDSYPTDKAKRKKLLDRKIQFAKKIFPLRELQNKSQWLLGFYKYLQSDEKMQESEAEKYHNRLDSILSYVWGSYEIPVVKLPHTLSLENVATVFERINSKGTLLGIFDLLNARFIVHDINLKDMWKEVLENHEELKKWYRDDKDEKIPLYIIQAMTLLETKKLQRGNMLNLDDSYKNSGVFQKERFQKSWHDMAKYVKKTVQIMTSVAPDGFGAINYNLMPSPVMVPIIVCFLKNIEGRKDYPRCMEKIRYWYWNSTLGDRYSKSTTTVGEADYRDMLKWFSNDDFDPFEKTEEILYHTSNINDSIYKSVMRLIAKNNARDFIQDKTPNYDKLEEHHIFPKSNASIYHAEETIDNVLNRTLILGETNRIISNKNPSQYLKKIIMDEKINEEKLRKRLATHFISTKAFECMMKDDFHGFIKAREQTIRTEFEKLVKK